MSVAEIYRRLKNRQMSVVSVSRTVQLLSDLGILRTADVSKGIQLFELAERFTGHHHHLICERCGRVEDVYECLMKEDGLPGLRRRIERSHKFRVTNHDLKLFGYCQRCRMK